jgi:hypothetical protein
MPGPANITYGNVGLTMVLTASLTPASVGSAVSAEQTFTVNGLQVGDQVSGISLQAAWTVLVDIVNFRVTAANTLGISFQNNTAGALTPPAGTYLVEINRSVPLNGNPGSVGAFPSAIV